MKYYYILNKIAKVPAGSYSIKYAKEITLTSVKFTASRSGARKLRFIYAILYASIHGLSMLQCKEMDESALRLTRTGDTGNRLQ
jgi:hypothetical protein